MKTAEKVELGMGEAHRLYWERAREPALLLYVEAEGRSFGPEALVLDYKLRRGSLFRPCLRLCFIYGIGSSYI